MTILTKRMALTLESITAFGTYGFNKVSKNDFSFIRNLAYDDSIDRFKTMCRQILKERGDNVNQMEFDGLLYRLMKAEPENVNEAVFDLISEASLEFRDWISQKIQEGTFNIDTFREGYSNFYRLKQNLSRQLRHFENCVNKPTSKSYSHIMLMANYAFYKNVVDQTYSYKGKQCQLHKILGDIINERNVTIDKILPIFQMFKFYERLSFAAGKRREELFNVKDQQEFLVNLGSNAGFVRSLVAYINNGFNQLLLCANDADKTRKLKGIKDVVKMGTQFHEREMFLQYYRKSLESRLFETVADLTAEKECVALFRENKNDNRTVQRMNDMIRDISECREHKKFIDRLDVKITPATKQRYESVGLDTAVYDQRKITVIPLAHGVWDCTLVENVGNFNVPLELQLYLDIFNAYYTKRFTNRRITYDFNNGTAVISMVLSGVKYSIEVTTPQLFILQQFNRFPEISAKDLAKNVGMTLKQLTPVLNSLITCKLIDRQTGDKTDPNLKFFVNTKFKCNQKEFSIVSTMNQTNKTEEVDKQVQEQFAHKREDIVKCCIVKILKNNNSMTADVLFSSCMSAITIFEITPQLFKVALTNAIKENYVEQKTKEDNNSKYYKYVDKEDSDDELNEDEE